MKIASYFILLLPLQIFDSKYLLLFLWSFFLDKLNVKSQSFVCVIIYDNGNEGHVEYLVQLFCQKQKDKQSSLVCVVE